MAGIFKINNNEVFGSDGTFSGTIGSNARLAQGSIANVHCSTPSSITTTLLTDSYSTTLTGSSVSYTPATGARYVVYQYVYAVDNQDVRGIYGLQLHLDGQKMTVADLAGGGDTGGTDGNFSTGGKSVLVSIDLSAITSNFNGHSSGHNWQTNAGGTSAFNAGTLSVVGARHSGTYDVIFNRIQNSGNNTGFTDSNIAPTTIIYSVM